MVSDGSWVVRVQAAKLLVRTVFHTYAAVCIPFLERVVRLPPTSLPLSSYTTGVETRLLTNFLLPFLQGSMLQVSSHFLEQTLDKKLMSDLRVRKLWVFSLLCVCVSKPWRDRSCKTGFLFAYSFYASRKSEAGVFWQLKAGEI